MYETIYILSNLLYGTASQNIVACSHVVVVVVVVQRREITVTHIVPSHVKALSSKCFTFINWLLLGHYYFFPPFSREGG